MLDGISKRLFLASNLYCFTTRPNYRRKKVKRPVFVILLFVSVACCGTALRFLSWYNQPFRLKPYLDYVHSKGLYVTPPSDVLKYATENSLLVNQPAAFDTGDLRPRAYVIDADRLISDWRTPVSFRKFTRSTVYSSGVTFACQQVLLVDGSMLKLSPREFLARYSASPEKEIDEDLEGNSLEVFFMFIFFHEHGHLSVFDLTPGHEQTKLLEQAWEQGNDALANAQYGVAVARYQDALRICPAYYEALDHLARAESRRGNFSRAIELYRKSLTINPKNHVARNNIVIALVSSGQLNEALRQIDANERADSTNAENVFWLGMIRIRLGDLMGSYAAFTKARERYRIAKDDKVVHANLLRYALVITSKDISIEPEAIFQQHIDDCKEIPKTSELAEICKIGEQEFRLNALKVLSAALLL
jgi:tetratricopeptide (TPR) repeat protein